MGSDARVPLDVAAKHCEVHLHSLANDDRCEKTLEPCCPGEPPCVFAEAKEPWMGSYDDRIGSLEQEVYSHRETIGRLNERDNMIAGRLRKLEHNGSLPTWTVTIADSPKTEYISVDESQSKSYWLLEMNQDEVKYLGDYVSVEDALSNAAMAARWEVVILEVSQNRLVGVSHYWYSRGGEKWECDDICAVRYGDTL